MTRDQIKGVFDAAKKVERALEDLPYQKARAGMRALDEMRDLVAEQLPGHEYAECGHCEEAKGINEMVDVGDERMCQACEAALQDAADVAAATASLADFDRNGGTSLEALKRELGN